MAAQDPTPTDDEPTLLALSQAEAVSATCYDGLLTIPPAVLTPAERADLDAARVRVSRLYCSLASRRGERRVAVVAAERERGRP